MHFQILSSRHCQNVFPVKFDGGWGTLWTSFVAHNLNNFSVLQTKKIKISNKRINPTGLYGGKINKNSDLIWKNLLEFFPELVKEIYLSKDINTTIKLSNLILANSSRPIEGNTNKKQKPLENNNNSVSSTKTNIQKTKNEKSKFNERKFDFEQEIKLKDNFSIGYRHTLFLKILIFVLPKYHSTILTIYIENC